METPPLTLCVQFPKEQWPGWHISELNLHSQPATSHSESSSDSGSNESCELCTADSRLTVSVDPETCTDYGSDSPVFRAFVVRDDGDDYPKECHHSLSFSAASQHRGLPPPQKTSIALKFALREDLLDDLAQEAEVYEGALRCLQGVIVPRCYGFFTGIGLEGQQIACLALEFWGESLRAPFKMLPIDIRMRILDSLGQLHRCGLHHGDFAERNVLMSGNDIRLIDFDQSVYHDCDCEASFEFRPAIGKQIPDVTEFGCPTLWEICRSDMRIWG